MSKKDILEKLRQVKGKATHGKGFKKTPPVISSGSPGKAPTERSSGPPAGRPAGAGTSLSSETNPHPTSKKGVKRKIDGKTQPRESTPQPTSESTRDGIPSDLLASIDDLNNGIGLEPVSSEDIILPTASSINTNASQPTVGAGSTASDTSSPPQASSFFKAKIIRSNARQLTRTVNPAHFTKADGSPIFTPSSEGSRAHVLHTTAKKGFKKNQEPAVPVGSLDYAQRVTSQCKHCLKKFSRVSFYQKHVNSSSCFLSSQNKGFWCSFCTKFFSEERDKIKHERIHLLNRNAQSGGSNLADPMLRLRDRHGCKVYLKKFDEGEINSIEGSFMQMKAEIINKVTTDLQMHKIVKFGIVTVGIFAKLDQDGNELDKIEMPMRSTHFRLFLSDLNRIKMYVNRIQKQTLQRLEEIEQTGSGWTILGVAKVFLEVGKCNLIGGSGGKISVPFGQQYIIDVDLGDELCFANAFAQHFIGNHDLETTREWICNNLKLKGIKFPLSLQKVGMFERRHADLNVGINVFLLEGKQCFPVHKSVHKRVDNCANILLVPYVEQKKKRYHYVYITDLDLFLNSYQTQLGTKRQKNYKHCLNCLSSFSTIDRLKEHQLTCLNNEVQKIEFPPPGKKLKFENHLNAFGHEFIGFADFEACLTPFNRENHTNCLNCQELGDISLCKHKTQVLNDQEPVCYSLIFVDRDKNVVFQRSEIAENVMPLFFKALEDAQELLLPQLQAAKSQMVWTAENEKQFRSAQKCHICNEPFEKPRDKVRDHCHRTGKWMGPAHWRCNVDRRVKTHLLCFMHNFSGYDSHFIIKHYERLEGKEKRISGMAYNSQRFRTLDLGKIKFLDSLSLLDASLNELVGDLVKQGHTFPIIKNSGIYQTKNQRNLLINSKGIYPYEHIASYNILSETQLPPRESFFSVLKGESVSEQDYQMALKTFKAFKCRDLKDYTRLYCHLDTLQLAEVVFEFMLEVQRDFGLCCTNYISLPQLSFDAMLKSTGVVLDYIPDPEMTLLFENSIRGGVSYVNTRIVDIEKEGGIIEYYDANNLYGKAQMEFLPMGDYRWLSKKELEQFKDQSIIMSKPKDDPKGWIFEVDLHYPEKLRVSKMHQNMPLAPEHLEIFYPDLSEYSKECLDATTGKKSNKRYHSSKLCGTFYDKKRYLVHYRNLQFYLKHGLELTKIHRVIEFRQGDFSKAYIEFCTKKRATTKSEFKKRMAKLMANANYGKWLQNVRKYIDVKIVSRTSTAAKWINSPRFISSRQLSPDLIAIFLKKQKVVLDRKYSIGFTILEISKLMMYEYFYEVIVPRFGQENVDIILSDTDSFILHIREHSREQARQKMADVMDYSNLDKSDPFFNSARAKVPGYLKTETPTSHIKECVALKSKCYAIRSAPNDPQTRGEEKIEKKCKGITHNSTKTLKIDSYRKCINDMSVIKTDVARMQSKNHHVQTVLQNKISLTSFCDKRFLLHCGKHSLPYQKGGWLNVCNYCN